MPSADSLLVLKETDNVAVARAPLADGTIVTVGDRRLTIHGDVPAGHKVAISDIETQAPVFKYGYQIGVASEQIKAGDYLHTHNVQFSSHTKPSPDDFGTRSHELPGLPARTTFLGARRSDGRTATRNYIAVVSTVNCSATVCRMIEDEARRRDLLRDYPNVDGVMAVTHTLGCAMPVGRGTDILRRTLAGYAAHPNVAGLLVIGLGCEGNQIDQMVKHIVLRPGTPIARMNIQFSGGSRATVDSALAAIAEMLPEVNASFVREERPVSELVLGLNCGGSDAFSGLTANPALGYASDLIVAQGGRSVLAETPEIYGAESMLVRRATSRGVASGLLDMIDWWEDYTASSGTTMDANPSPGNKAGGITTILEKSLGAVAKAGQAPLSAVYDYAKPIDTDGLGFMDTPGYDPVSVTGLIAGGANLVCFTTGRGSALGTRPAPTLKLATNTDLYQRMPDDMDVDCGPVFTGGASLEEKGTEIYNALLDLASGKPSNSEALGYGSNEFVPWHIGAVM